MWGPMVEKGWAKVMGSYLNASGTNNSVNALRFMTNAPTPSFDLSELQAGDMDESFSMLKSSME